MPTTARYLHGTSPEEQARLVRQASVLETVLLEGLSLSPGERVLEVGCGVGAVLGKLAAAFPGVRLAGADVSPEQVAGARRHLGSLGVEAELVVADGARLPWDSRSFDHVVMVWVVEHLADPLAVLREALRVLRRGGTLHLTETDYDTLRVSPPDAAIRACLDAYVARFDSVGDAHAGPRLGGLLERAGFADVAVRMVGIHHWCPSGAEQVESFVEYLLEFVRPEVPAMLALAGTPELRHLVSEGLARFERLAHRPDGSVSVSIYKAAARAPG
jgi:ubiquinone/menaquinone biosynthesis C-methylase UbiE